MKVDTAADHFDEMTNFLGREAKLYVLDSLACVFHNEGYSLEGNTEHNDTRWLANRISQAPTRKGSRSINASLRRGTGQNRSDRQGFASRSCGSNGSEIHQSL